MTQNEKTTQELIDIRNACGSRVVLDGKSIIAPIDDKAFFDKCLMYSESKNLHEKNTVAWRPMSDTWKNSCKNMFFWFQDTVAEAKKMFPEMDERLFEKFSRRILVTSVMMQRAYARLHQTRTEFLTPSYASNYLQADGKQV